MGFALYYMVSGSYFKLCFLSWLMQPPIDGQQADNRVLCSLRTQPNARRFTQQRCNGNRDYWI